MKKYLTFLLVLTALTLLFVACGETENAPSAGQTPLTNAPVETSSVPVEPGETGKTPETGTPETSKETSEETSAETTAETTAETAAETTSPVIGGSDRAKAIVDLARKKIGTAFRLGGVGPDEFDNTGFVYYVCRENGVAIPRRGEDMATYGKAVAKEDILPGDVIILSNEVGGPVGFVGICVGDGKFIACSNPDTPTAELNYNSTYWTPRFISARRVA